jgi:hypothetical protein
MRHQTCRETTKSAVAEAAQPCDAPLMVTRRKAAGYVLALAVTAILVFFLVPLAYGTMIWLRWLGR